MTNGEFVGKPRRQRAHHVSSMGLRWVVRLPDGASSPTNSIYKTHDIVEQTYSLWSSGSKAKILRSRGPFTVSYLTSTGKKREVSAKEDPVSE